jgi:hypothetical protein
MLEFHQLGGMEHMTPITLLFLVNIVLFGIACAQWFRTRQLNSSLLEWIWQVALFALAFGAFGTVMALRMAFASLSQQPEPLPVNVIMGGLEAAIVNVVYGFIVFLISMAAQLLLKLMGRSSVSK